MKNKKKGFTLVELIVVLAILAILAAMLVPALTGYIDKANAQKITATTRQVVMAAQTEVSENYATLSTTEANNEVTLTSGSADAQKKMYNRILVLAEVATGNEDSITAKNGVEVISIKYSKGNVSQVVVKQSGKTCTYTSSDGKYTVS